MRVQTRPYSVMQSKKFVLQHLISCRNFSEKPQKSCYMSLGTFGSRFKRTKSLAQLSLANRPFAGSGHMVRNRLCWDANKAAGLQNKGTLTSPARHFFCFESPMPTVCVTP